VRTGDAPIKATKLAVPVVKGSKKEDRMPIIRLSETKSFDDFKQCDSRASRLGPYQIPRATMRSVIMMSTVHRPAIQFNHRPFGKFAALRLDPAAPQHDAHV